MSKASSAWSGQAVQKITGWDVTLEELMTVGERRLNLMRAFNAREGFTRKDDVLPPKLFKPKEGGPTDGALVDPDELERAKDTYYAMCGWDEQGIPTRAKLEELSLDTALRFTITSGISSPAASRRRWTRSAAKAGAMRSRASIQPKLPASSPASSTTSSSRCSLASTAQYLLTRLSWQFESGLRGQSQTAYRVLAAGKGLRGTPIDPFGKAKVVPWKMMLETAVVKKIALDTRFRKNT